jgi:phosphatidylglycerophosphate synthase
VVIAAGPAGKYKAVTQNIFIGSSILWYALLSAAERNAWNGPVWEGWKTFHFSFSVFFLSIAVVLTVYSMLVYLWGYWGAIPARRTD